jgi:ATP-dependent Clp protease adapter protein ClpS
MTTRPSLSERLKAAPMSTMPALEQLAEPDQRNAVHRKGQAAVGALEREHHDRDHRPVEKQHKQAAKNAART